MSLPEFSLYCEIDGQCVVQEQGEANTWRFTDVLQAMDFLITLKNEPGATLTIYDPLGRETFKSPL